MNLPWLSRSAKSILFATPLRKLVFPPYLYMFSPEQLSFFVECVTKTNSVPGDIMEIGCANGLTAVFLNKHLDTLPNDKSYICIDTFSGFTPEDKEYEETARNKNKNDYYAFQVNKKEWVEWGFTQNNISRTKIYEMDVSKFKAEQVPALSFCLLDVDVYLPTKYALEITWPKVSKGGIVVVDDCRKDNNFDGALQAYQEFCAKNNLSEEIVLGKLGILRK